ncbi:hypothetical protein [Synechococcus sp. M16CYN]
MGTVGLEHFLCRNNLLNGVNRLRSCKALQKLRPYGWYPTTTTVVRI